MVSPLRLYMPADQPGLSASVAPIRTAFRIDYSPEAFPARGPAASLAAQFPQVRFQPLARSWSGALGAADLVITGADAADPVAIDHLSAQISGGERAESVIVFLDHPDVDVTRRLIRAGAADVLAAPITESALAVSLERLLARREVQAGGGPGHKAQVVGFLKAGGGVGATALATQLAVILAARGQRVCLIDFDVQFGSAAMYLDLEDALTLDDVLAAGDGIADLAFGAQLSAHASGARVLAAPREFVALDDVDPAAVEALLITLRREFDVVLLDLPPSWTTWSHRALRLADDIVLVSQLSVAHAHRARRQQRVLAAQGLDGARLLVVCNQAGGDAASGVSAKAFERAIGRHVDAVLPSDPKLMNEAINQGVALSAVRRGAKLERALVDLATVLSPQQVEAARAGRGRR